MIVGSKDPEVNKIRFRSSNKIFQNSSCVFVEYTDAIQIPWFTFLTFFKENKKVDDLFKTDEIRYLSVQALLAYYFNRPYRNPLVGLLKENSVIELEKLDEMLDEMVNGTEIFFNKDVDTFICPMINNLIKNDMIKKLVIYYPTENEFVKEDIKHKFGDKAILVTGDIKKAILSTPQDTTYFFSDAMNVLILEETKKINFSAIMLPVNYRYNYVDDERSKFVVDMDYLSKNYTFKWATYKLA